MFALFFGFLHSRIYDIALYHDNRTGEKMDAPPPPRMALKVAHGCCLQTMYNNYYFHSQKLWFLLDLMLL